MAKISVRGRERDRLYKKTKAGTLGRMSLALDLTLSQHMHSGGGIWKHGTRALPSCVPFQPCRYPEDCPMAHHSSSGNRSLLDNLQPRGAFHLVLWPALLQQGTGPHPTPAPLPLWDPRPDSPCPATLLDRHGQLMVFSLAPFCALKISHCPYAPCFLVTQAYDSLSISCKISTSPRVPGQAHLVSNFLSYPYPNVPLTCSLPQDTSL